VSSDAGPGYSGLAASLGGVLTESKSGEGMGTEERANTTGQRVLLVEDDEGIARMLHFSLAAAGFEITWVSTGADALRLLEQGLAQAVVLDPGLPDNLGRAVLEWLRRVNPSGFPVWVVISALDHREATRRYGPVGTHFFGKPFDPWDLVRTLEELLRGKREEALPDVETP
jgi:DNA-binding response OmpR family regulator